MTRAKKRQPGKRRPAPLAAGNKKEGTGLSPEKIQRAMDMLRLGRREESEALFAELARLPLRPPLLVNQLGVLAHLLGKRDLALDLLQQSVTREPSAPLLNNLGLVREQLGDLSGARNAYEQALAAAPAFAEAHYNLGNLLQKQHLYPEAIEEYRQALKSRPDYPAAYNNLACARIELGDLAQAEADCLEAVRLSPGFGEAINTWGRIMQQRVEPEMMLASAGRMAKFARDRVAVFASLGSIFASLGRKEEAVRCFQEALLVSPDNGKVHYLLAKVTGYRSPEDLKGIEDAYARGPAAGDRHYLCFALGKAYEDIGDYPSAFRFIKAGNALLRATYSYSLQEDRHFISRLQSAFSADFIARSRMHGQRDATPIFVVGMPRSGTTLVEQILASHPQVHGAGELQDLDRLFRETLHDQGPLPCPEGVRKLHPGQFGKMGTEYVARLRRLSAVARVVDKMPHNFLYLGLIRIILPQAKIIHCRRDPMDTCWSLYKNIFDTPHPYAQDLAELGQYYRFYQELMVHWRQVLPGGLFEIDYEQVIDNQEKETRKLVEYCGLPWDEACLNFHQAGRRVLTSSMTQVCQPIYRSSLQKWRCYEKELEPLRAALGRSQA